MSIEDFIAGEATKYADSENSCYANDHAGFVAGANWALCLLKKYIEHIKDRESIDYIGGSDIMTSEEWDFLQEISENPQQNG